MNSYNKVSALQTADLRKHCEDHHVVRTWKTKLYPEMVYENALFWRNLLSNLNQCLLFSGMAGYRLLKYYWLREMSE